MLPTRRFSRQFLLLHLLLSDSPSHFPNAFSGSFREKGLSPRRAPRRSLLPLSPKRTQVRLKHSFSLFGSRQIHSEPTGGLRGKSAVYGLNGLRPTLRVGSLHLNPRPRSALLRLRPFSVGRFALLRSRQKNMSQHIFQS